MVARPVGQYPSLSADFQRRYRMNEEGEVRGAAEHCICNEHYISKGVVNEHRTNRPEEL